MNLLDYSARLTVGAEQLVTTTGTIIPQAVRFADGSMLLVYHVGFDAWFAPVGMSRSSDGGTTWSAIEPPLYRSAACGAIGDQEAIFLDDYLVHDHGDEYFMLFNRTTDGGRTFQGVQKARCVVPNLIPSAYVPAAAGSPQAAHCPPMPEWYRKHLGDAPRFGAHPFGRVVRLSDGALAAVCYGKQPGNLPKRRARGGLQTGGIADVVDAGESTSAILLRSEDNGLSWRARSICGKLEPGRPFDGGHFYSSGFNETGLAEVAPGELFVVMRHGMHQLLWSNRSADMGLTWQGLRPMNHAGVAPNLCKLPGGVLAGAWGRPGLTVALSLDGSGQYWHLATELMRGEEASQMYAWLEAVDERRLLVFYDRRKWDKPHARYVNHGIYMRAVTLG